MENTQEATLTLPLGSNWKVSNLQLNNVLLAVLLGPAFSQILRRWLLFAVLDNACDLSLLACLCQDPSASAASHQGERTPIIDPEGLEFLFVQLECKRFPAGHHSNQVGALSRDHLAWTAKGSPQVMGVLALCQEAADHKDPCKAAIMRHCSQVLTHTRTVADDTGRMLLEIMGSERTPLQQLPLLPHRHL